MPPERISPINTIQDLTPAKQEPIYKPGWFLSSLVYGVSEEALPWMLSQGWEIASTVVDKTVYPWVTTYAMRRVVPQNFQILHDLLKELTNAYNEGRDFNVKRYNDILQEWNKVLVKSQDDMTDFAATKMDHPSTGHVAVMLSTTDALLADYQAYKAEMGGVDETERTGELTNLKVAWNDIRSEIESDFDAVKGSYSLDAIIAKSDTAIGKFDQAVNAFNAAYLTLPTTLRGDFTAHRGIARGLLDGLGATELARINEQFDNLLAQSRQSLVNRGFYSGALATQTEARVERERQEAIASLNDRLAREKLSNEHQLYQQEFQSRLGGLEGSMKTIDAASRVVQATMQNGQWSVEIRHKLLELETNMRMTLLGTRERYYKLLLENMDWQDRRREALYAKLMEVRMRQFEIRDRVSGKEMDFLRYRVDERNKLALGFFGVMERRQDTYPDIGQMAQLISALSDGGLVTP